MTEIYKNDRSVKKLDFLRRYLHASVYNFSNIGYALTFSNKYE